MIATVGNRHDLDRTRAALLSIPSDVSRHEWLVIASAPTYDPQACRTAWSGFGRGTTLSGAAVSGVAAEPGVLIVRADPPATREPRYKLLGSADLHALPSLAWRVRGVLPAGLATGSAAARPACCNRGKQCSRPLKGAALAIRMLMI